MLPRHFSTQTVAHLNVNYIRRLSLYTGSYFIVVDCLTVGDQAYPLKVPLIPAVFERILPLATSRGIRVVCINRRDYPGSTLCTTDELKVIYDRSDEERAAFLNARGVEIALFLDSLIDVLGLPAPTEDGTNGGLELMGWSMGTMFVMCTAASIPSFPPHVQTRLQLYVRRMILFGKLDWASET